MLVTRIATILMVFFLISCDEDSVEPITEEVRFQGILLDAKTGDPIPDIDIRFFEELGCVAIFGDQNTTTDNAGLFEIIYTREMDTLQAAAVSFDVELTYTSYSINIADPFIYLEEMKLGDLDIRPNRDENLQPTGETITIRGKKMGSVIVYARDESIDNELTIFDTNLALVEDFVPGKFTSNFGSPSTDIAARDDIAQYALEEGRLYNLEISIREGDSYEDIDNWPVVKTVLFENISADFREVIELEEIVY